MSAAIIILTLWLILVAASYGIYKICSKDYQPPKE